MRATCVHTNTRMCLHASARGTHNKARQAKKRGANVAIASVAHTRRSTREKTEAEQSGASEASLI